MELLNASGYRDIMCIYKIGHDYTGKVYIGSTNDLQDRINNHIKNLKNGTHINKQLQYSWDASNDKNVFSIEIIELIDDESFLPYAELYYIEKFKRVKGVYNISDPLEEIKVLKSRQNEAKKKERLEKKENKNKYVEFKNKLDKDFEHLFAAMKEKLKENHNYISYKKVSDYLLKEIDNNYEPEFFHKSLKSYIRNSIKASIYNFESEGYLDDTLNKYNILERELTILNRELGNEISTYNREITEKLNIN